jgi:hypothetical protein
VASLSRRKPRLVAWRGTHPSLLPSLLPCSPFVYLPLCYCGAARRECCWSPSAMPRGATAAPIQTVCRVALSRRRAFVGGTPSHLSHVTMWCFCSEATKRQRVASVDVTGHTMDGLFDLLVRLATAAPARRASATGRHCHHALRCGTFPWCVLLFARVSLRCGAVLCACTWAGLHGAFVIWRWRRVQRCCVRGAAHRCLLHAIDATTGACPRPRRRRCCGVGVGGSCGVT